MPADAAFVDYVLELFAALGQASARAMFGGHGLYLDGVIVGLAMDGRLYLKTDAATQPDFAAAGCAPFVYTSSKVGGHKASIEMSYWSVPEAALDSAEDMTPWLRRARDAASRKARKRKPKR